MSNHVALLLTGHLTVDVVTGAITLVKSFDRERSDTLILTVEARDLGTPQLSDQALVKIFLTDVNDNAPQIRPRKMNAAVFEVSCVLCLFYFEFLSVMFIVQWSGGLLISFCSFPFSLNVLVTVEATSFLSYQGLAALNFLTLEHSVFPRVNALPSAPRDFGATFQASHLHQWD